MKRLAFLLAAFALTACTTSHSQTANASLPAPLAHGRELVETHCSSCHATGVTGDSPAPEAPTFRTLSRHYRVDTLEEALAEGITVGHPAMPQFEFAPQDVSDIVSYLQSIQEDRAATH